MIFHIFRKIFVNETFFDKPLRNLWKIIVEIYNLWRRIKWLWRLFLCDRRDTVKTTWTFFMNMIFSSTDPDFFANIPHTACLILISNHITYQILRKHQSIQQWVSGELLSYISGCMALAIMELEWNYKFVCYLLYFTLIFALTGGRQSISTAIIPLLCSIRIVGRYLSARGICVPRLSSRVWRNVCARSWWIPNRIAIFSTYTLYVAAFFFCRIMINMILLFSFSQLIR